MFITDLCHANKIIQFSKIARVKFNFALFHKKLRESDEIFVTMISHALSMEPKISIFSFTFALIASKPGASSFRGSKTFALKILALLDVFSGSLRKYQLALCIHIDLGHAKGDCLFDHIIRDTCTSVKH